MATQQGGAEIGEGHLPNHYIGRRNLRQQPAYTVRKPPQGWQIHRTPSWRRTNPRCPDGYRCNNVPLVGSPVAFSLDSKESNSMKSANPHSGCRETDVARTIDTTNPDPSKNQGGIAILQESICIAGNTIDRQPENGGNGLGCQADISYTLTGATAMRCVNHIKRLLGLSAVVMRKASVASMSARTSASWKIATSYAGSLLWSVNGFKAFPMAGH